jgi:hypothetical protein
MMAIRERLAPLGCSDEAKWWSQHVIVPLLIPIVAAVAAEYMREFIKRKDTDEKSE